MAGFTRRSKPLRASTSLEEVTDVILTNPSDGDLLVYDNLDGVWRNSHDLTGAYVIDGSLAVTDLGIDGDLDLTGELTVLGPTLLQGGLSVIGNSTFTGSVTALSLTLAGTLAGTGFSFSGSGTIAGTLTVGGAVGITGNLSLAGSLSVALGATLRDLVVSDFIIAMGNISAIGSISAGNGLSGLTLGIGGNADILGDLTLGAGAVYTATTITFIDDDTAWKIRHGNTLSLSLNTVSIVEGTGEPNGNVTANPGSLYLRIDQFDDRTLYYKVRGHDSATGWVAVVDLTSDVSWLFEQSQEQSQTLLHLQEELSDLRRQLAAL